MIRAAAAALVVASVALAFPARAAEPVEAGQEDAVLVEVRVDQLTLAESLGARPAPDGGLRLPLGELARALGLAIEVQPAAGTASGFVLREDRPFRLDVGAGSASLAGRRQLRELDRALLALNASPGGAADLLAACLFLDRLPAALGGWAGSL